MVSITALWLPVLVAGVLVFIVSSVIHMMLPYHRTDFGKIPSEDTAADSLRAIEIPPGDYIIPHAGSPEVMRSEEFLARYEKGPVVFMTVLPNGPPAMGASLIQWFVYSIVIGGLAGYIAGLALAPGAHYREVFHVVAVTAFLGYTAAGWQNSIWYKRSWATTAKFTFDGLVYALVTAGTFGWLWPA